ncbi:MAG: hypothetical protein ACRDQ7_15625 [Haloechinothrix sp.]
MNQHVLTPDEAREIVSAWLRANDVNPTGVPIDTTIAVHGRSGKRRLWYTVFIGGIHGAPMIDPTDPDTTLRETRTLPLRTTELPALPRLLAAAANNTPARLHSDECREVLNWLPRTKHTINPALAVRDAAGNIIDMPLLDGHPAGCRGTTHAPGCVRVDEQMHR